MIVDPSGAPAKVASAIRQAARATGADFQYLLATAQVESNLNPDAKVATSSARGLFQFVEQTWLATLKEEGPALGYRAHADAISRLPSGEYVVTDRRNEAAVLNLRFDPTANALMAGAFTRSNAGKLAAAIGRPPTEGELYLAHFLGAGGAGRLIGLAASSPRARAAEAFPSAARANPSIFYDQGRRMRGVGEVYRMLVGRYDHARSARPEPAPAPVATRTAPLRPTIAAKPAPPTEPVPPPPAQADAGPIFHGLFRMGVRPEPVAPAVNALWGTAKPQPLPEPAAQREPAPAAPAGGPLDLFQEQAPDVRALFRGRV